MDDEKRILAMNLTRLISEKGKTQAEVADALRINRSTLNMWCKGLAYPRAGKIQLLADYFGVGKSAIIEAVDTKDYSVSRLLHLIKYADLLNDTGISKLEERAEELIEIPKYRKGEK